MAVIKSTLYHLLSGCVIVVLVYIFHSPRVTLDVMLAAATAYLLIAFALAALYSLVFDLDSQSFRPPG
jgi:hypothetical protein